MVTLRVEVADTAFTDGCAVGYVLRMPVAHGEGCYFADDNNIAGIERAASRSSCATADAQGRVVPEANPNGSIENIAGICNRERKCFRPHAAS